MLRNAFFIVIIWVVLFGLIEMSAGLVAGNKYAALDHRAPESADDIPGYFAPDQHRHLFYPGLEPYQVSTNRLGFRSVGVDMSEEMIRDKEKILCLGDSHTLGLFVDDRETYPYQLQQLLGSSGSEAVVLNAGVGGATITDYHHYLKSVGLELNPSIAIINFSSNDIDNLNKPTFKWDEYSRSRRFDLLHHLRHSNTVRALMGLYMRFKLELRLRRIEDPRARQIVREGTDSLDETFYVLRKNPLQAVVIDPASRELQPLWDRYLESLGETIELLRSRGIRVIVFAKPEILVMFEQVEQNFEDVLKAFLKRYDVTYVDMLPGFIERRNDYRELFVKPPGDLHLAPLGNTIVADKLYQVL